MTLPENRAPRKPGRMGLYAPFAALAVAALAWSLAWIWTRDETFRRMDAAAGALARAGWRTDWSGRSLSGYPFRLDLDLAGARARDASGWGLAAPRLKAESIFLFGRDHWVIVAPAGATLTRRSGGPVTVEAKVLRASLLEASASPPRLSVEGLDLTFHTPPGTAPFAFAHAEEARLHTRSGPGGQGAVRLEIDRATTAAPGVLAAIAGGGPVTLIADGVYSHAGAPATAAERGGGGGVAGALRAWSDAGGSLAVRQLSLQAAGASAEARSGVLDLGADGRLRGSLPMTLKGAPRLIAAIAGRGGLAPEAARAALAVLAAHAGAPDGPAAVTLDFQAGQTTLGPVAIGPAPRVY
jgi:hypothetical protein